MRIDNIVPPLYLSLPQFAAVVHNPATIQVNNLPQVRGLSYPGAIVDISPEGWAAYERSKIVPQANEAGEITDKEHGCVTCDSRRYQDVSNDSSVSFQAPTYISPELSAAVVRAHEYEHVTNEQVKADQDGRKVVSQTVSLHSSLCPECNRPYISGGTTRTVTAEKNDECV